MKPIVRTLIYVGGVGLAIEGAYWIGRFYHAYKTLSRSRNEEINENIFTRDPIDKYKENQALAKLYDRPRVKQHYDAIVHLFDSAHHSINVAMYIMTCGYLVNALIRAKERGVVVRLITEKSMQGSSQAQLNSMRNNGVLVRIETRNMMHHKFCLIDVPDPRNVLNNQPLTVNEDAFKIPDNGLLITGSLNYTMEAFTSNHENIVVSSNKNHTVSYTDHFFALWDELDSDQQY